MKFSPAAISSYAKQKGIVARLSFIATIIWSSVCCAMTPRAANDDGRSFTHGESKAHQNSAGELLSRLRPSVFILQTVEEGNSDPSSKGSGFFISPAGRAVSNYHVVSDFLKRPHSQKLQAVLSTGAVYPARVIAIDVINDLAIVDVETGRHSHQSISLPIGPNQASVGVATYAIGSPGQLDLSIIAGHLSGSVNSLGPARLHFSGSLNEGMSGGPAVTKNGALVGVNVSKLRSAEQISFLVPASAVLSLLERAREQQLKLDRLDEEIGRQLLDYQENIVRRLKDAPASTSTLGSYKTPGFLTDGLKCKSRNEPGRDESDETKKVSYRQTTRACGVAFGIHIDDELGIVGPQFVVSHFEKNDLSSLKFANLQSQTAFRSMGRNNVAWMAKQQCFQRKILAGSTSTMPANVIVCAARYRKYAELYDIRTTITTRNSATQALVIRFSMDAITWENGVAILEMILRGLE